MTEQFIRYCYKHQTSTQDAYARRLCRKSSCYQWSRKLGDTVRCKHFEKRRQQ